MAFITQIRYSAISTAQVLITKHKETSMNIPGFVDLQVNGYKGVDFSSPDLTKEEFVSACQALTEQGTIAFLPTLVTAPVEIYKRNLKLIADAIENEELCESVLGIHVEGPFISPEEGAVGAHNPEWVRKPDIEFLDELCEWSNDNIKLLTIAAEVEGAAELCKHAVNRGITVSLGHQMADEADLQQLTDAGAQALTHLGNGLPHLIPRHQNPLWAGMANDNLHAMIITDGHHLPPSIIKTIIRTKGIANTAVVSDASSIAGLPPGRYSTLNNEAVLEESGLLHNPHTGYLVGSSATMRDCMNFLSSLDMLSTEELIRLGFYNPLELIDIDPAMVKKDAPVRLEREGKRFVVR
jgi:N-acetylglucosamine-6-phosphate deacetylase